MVPKQFMHRALRFGLCAGASDIVWMATPARCEANGPKAGRDCSGAYRHARESESAVLLREAQRAFRACAATTCSSSLRQRCASKADQLDMDIPSIVPLVTDQAGAPRLDVEVRMDGVLVSPHIDGSALPVDPGLHEFAFDVGGSLVTKRIMIAQGQRNRPISISLRKQVARDQPPGAAQHVVARLPAPTPPEASRSRSLALPIVLGSVGLLGGASYALLVYWGRQSNARLAQCTPDCPSASVQHIRNLYLAADISLGVAIAALGTATWLLLTGDSATERPKSPPSYALNLQPLRSGAFASIAGSF